MLKKSEALFLNEKFAIKSCIVQNGEVINAVTDEIIPLEHLSYQTMVPDGVYHLGEHTCGNAVPRNMKNTEENKKLHGCQVGRRLESCDMYSKEKCAVYSLSDLDSHTETISVKDIIQVFNLK